MKSGLISLESAREAYAKYHFASLTFTRAYGKSRDKSEQYHKQSAAAPRRGRSSFDVDNRARSAGPNA